MRRNMLKTNFQKVHTPSPHHSSEITSIEKHNPEHNKVLGKALKSALKLE